MSTNWISLSQSAGTGDQVVTVSATTNYGVSERQLKIKITTGDKTQYVFVTQEVAESMTIKYSAPAMLNLNTNNFNPTPIDHTYDGDTNIGTLYFNSEVTQIYDATFWGKDLEWVELPNTITYMGFSNFRESTIEAITMPDGITNILNDMFYSCTSLSSVTLPNALVTINHGVFNQCTSLSEINIPNSLRQIGNYAFYMTSSLPSIILPSAVNYIGSYAFAKSGIKSIVFPSAITALSQYMCSECTSLSSVTIPSAITRLNDGVFSGCTNLITITYQGTMEQWYNMYLSLTWRSNSTVRYVQCTDGIIDLDVNNIITYYSPYKLPEAEPGDNPPYTYNSGIHVSAFTPTLLSSAHTFNNGVGTLRFSSNVEVVGNEAFYDCSGMTGVELPKTNFVISGAAFNSCPSIQSIVIPGNVIFDPTSTLDGSVLFNGCTSLSAVSIPSHWTAIGNYMFQNCKSLTSYTIHNGVTEIGADAFAYCDNLVSVIIPSTVTKIGSGAFEECISLVSINIPNNITVIKGSTFFYCRSLPSLTIPKSVTKIEEQAIWGCENLTTINYTGTIAEWNNINIDSNNWYDVAATVVHCTDGDVPLT